MPEMTDTEDRDIVLVRVVGQTLATARVEGYNAVSKKWEPLPNSQVIKIVGATTKDNGTVVPGYAYIQAPDGIYQISLDLQGDLPQLVVPKRQPKLSEFEWPADQKAEAEQAAVAYEAATGIPTATVLTREGTWKNVQADRSKPTPVLINTTSNGTQIIRQYGFYDLDGNPLVTKTETENIALLKGFHWRKVPAQPAVFDTDSQSWLAATAEMYTMEADDPREPRTIEEAYNQAILSGKPEDLARAKQYRDLLDQPSVLQAWQMAEAALQREDAAKAQTKADTEQQRTSERRQYEWEMSHAADEAERGRIQSRWEADFGEQARQWRTQLENRQYEFGSEMSQRQWEQGQAAQREALKLGIDISRSPADWWALENLRYGDQPNRPYTGAEVAPRTWVADWLKFANQPTPQVLQPPAAPLAPTLQVQKPRLGAPELGSTEDAARTAIEQEARAAREQDELLFTSAQQTRRPRLGASLPEETEQMSLPNQQVLGPRLGAPLPPEPGSQGSPSFATEDEARAWRENQVRRPRLGAPLPEEAENVPLFDSLAEAPMPLPAIRFQAEKSGETAIINEREIPRFLEGGFKITKKVKLYDPPRLGGGALSPLVRLPQLGVRQALFGQPVSRPRNWATLGAPTAPSAQSWGRLPWEGRQLFQSEVERIGVPWESYAPEMANLWPSWGRQGRFQRMPELLGGRRT